MNDSFNRIITIPLFDILNLVITAEDYGFEQLLPDFWEMIDSRLSKKEIKAFAKSILDSGDEYTEEDYEHIVSYLKEFKKKYHTK